MHPPWKGFLHLSHAVITWAGEGSQTQAPRRAVAPAAPRLGRSLTLPTSPRLNVLTAFPPSIVPFAFPVLALESEPVDPCPVIPPVPHRPSTLVGPTPCSPAAPAASSPATPRSSPSARKSHPPRRTT